jgi:hypothetical protein
VVGGASGVAIGWPMPGPSGARRGCTAAARGASDVSCVTMVSVCMWMMFAAPETAVGRAPSGFYFYGVVLFIFLFFFFFLFFLFFFFSFFSFFSFFLFSFFLFSFSFFHFSY